MPLISILTPTCNHERFIDRMLDSVLNQTVQDWHMIVVDDGSTDRTVELIAARRDPRIQIICQPRQGRHALKDTYARALENARGPFIALLEGDDYWAPNFLESLLPPLRDPAVVLAYGITQHVDVAGALIDATTPTAQLLARGSGGILSNNPVGSAAHVMLSADEGVFTYPPATLIRRSALEAIGGLQSVDDGHAVDYATCLTLALHGKFHFVPEVLGFWRRHPAGANSSDELESMLRADARFAVDFARRHHDVLPEPKPDPALVAHRWDRYWAAVRLTIGRHLLVQRRWADARRSFLGVFHTPASAVRLAVAAAGVVCSYLHRDLEGPLSLRRKGVDLRRLYDAAPSAPR